MDKAPPPAARAETPRVAPRAVAVPSRGRAVSRSPSAVRAAKRRDLVLCGVVAIAAAAALEQVVFHRSFWPDEALVAANIVHRGFLGLTRPLAFEQGAPVGWLWAERAAVELFGNNGFSLVAFPLLCGIASYGLVAGIARRVCSPLAAVAATALVAWSPGLLFHATEVKQYSADVATTAAIALGTLACLGEPPGSARVPTRTDAGGSFFPFGGRRLVALGLFCAVALWFSYAAVLASVAAGAVLAIVAAARRSPRDLALVLGAFSPAGASAAADYALVLRHLTHDRYLLEYWRAGFPPEPLGPSSLAGFLLHAGGRLFADPGGFGVPGLAGVLFVVGAVVAFRRQPKGALASFAVIPAAVFAAVLRGYPLEGRLSLFLVPSLALGMAFALDLPLATLPAGAHQGLRRPKKRPGLRGVGRRALRVAPLLALVVTAAAPVSRFFGDIAHPIVVSEVRPLFRYVAHHEVPAEAVVLDPGASDAYQYYATTTGLHASFVVVPTATGGTCASPSALVPHGAQRVWLVFGYRISGFPPDWQRLVVHALAPFFEVRERVVAPRAAAYLLVRRPVRGVVGASTAGGPCLSLEPLPPLPATGLRQGPFGTGPLT